MSTFKIIETQEELDRIIGERLARQKEKYADYDSLKARVSELETENGALRGAVEEAKGASADFDKQIADLQGQVKAFEQKDLRLRVAVSKGLPVELAERLVGDDQDSLVADAERLVGFMKPSEPVAPLKTNEPTLSDDETLGIRNMLAEMKGE